MAKKYWKDTYDYERILEILNDYWLEEEDEEEVRVTMYFKHHNGEEQEKEIEWKNPKFHVSEPMGPLQTINAADLMQDNTLERIVALEKLTRQLSLRVGLLEEADAVNIEETIAQKVAFDTSLKHDEQEALMQRQIELQKILLRR